MAVYTFVPGIPEPHDLIPVYRWAWLVYNHDPQIRAIARTAHIQTKTKTHTPTGKLIQETPLLTKQRSAANEIHKTSDLAQAFIYDRYCGLRMQAVRIQPSNMAKYPPKFSSFIHYHLYMCAKMIDYRRSRWEAANKRELRATSSHHNTWHKQLMPNQIQAIQDRLDALSTSRQISVVLADEYLSLPAFDSHTPDTPDNHHVDTFRDIPSSYPDQSLSRYIPPSYYELKQYLADPNNIPDPLTHIFEPLPAAPPRTTKK